MTYNFFYYNGSDEKVQKYTLYTLQKYSYTIVHPVYLLSLNLPRKSCDEALKRVSSTFQADFRAYPDISSITNSCDTWDIVRVTRLTRNILTSK